MARPICAMPWSVRWMRGRWPGRRQASRCWWWRRGRCTAPLRCAKPMPTRCMRLARLPPALWRGWRRGGLRWAPRCCRSRWWLRNAVPPAPFALAVGGGGHQPCRGRRPRGGDAWWLPGCAAWWWRAPAWNGACGVVAGATAGAGGGGADCATHRVALRAAWCSAGPGRCRGGGFAATQSPHQLDARCMSPHVQLGPSP